MKSSAYFELIKVIFFLIDFYNVNLTKLDIILFLYTSSLKRPPFLLSIFPQCLKQKRHINILIDLALVLLHEKFNQTFDSIISLYQIYACLKDTSFNFFIKAAQVPEPVEVVS